MLRTFKSLSLIAAFLSFSQPVYARGGTPTPVTPLTLVSATVQTCPVAFGCTAPIVAADHTITITIYATSDNGDNPWIEQTSGPALVPTEARTAGRSPDAHGGVNTLGLQYAVYEWTPSRADIGVDFTATFLLTSSSGATLPVIVPIGVVQDQPDPKLVTDLTITQVGDLLAIRWTPPADDHVTFYQLSACLPQDRTIGTPVCVQMAMPGVKTVADPSGTATDTAIPAVADVGSFPPPIVNFKLTFGPYPATPTPIAYIHLIAANMTSIAGAQDYVMKLPQ